MKLSQLIPVIYNWVDIVGMILISVIPIGLLGHITGNFLTGRIHKRFVLKKWPHHDKPFKALPRRMAHLVHVICMVGLAITGMYLHFPFFDADRILIKYIHYFFAFIVGINYVFRVWWSFFSDYPDSDEFVLTWKEIKVIPAVVKYYAFMADDKPHLADFNPMQKITYLSFAAVMPIIGLTGISLIFGEWLLPPVARFFGDLPTTKLFLRLIHYLCNWFFILFTVVHAYLAVSEDFPAFLYFFFNIEHEPHEEHGHPEHHEEHHEAVESHRESYEESYSKPHEESHGEPHGTGGAPEHEH